MKTRKILLIVGLVLISLAIIGAPTIGAIVRDMKSIIPEKPVVVEPYPDEYRDSDAVAYVVSSTNEGPFDWGADYWTKREYSLKYNGELTITTQYCLSGESVRTVNIDYSEFKEIQKQEKAFIGKKALYVFDMTQYIDGTTWSFVSFKRDGISTHLFSGHTDKIPELESIIEILASHSETDPMIARAYELFGGNYVCPDDNTKSVKIYEDADVYYVLFSSPEGDELYELSYMKLTEDYLECRYVDAGRTKFISFSYSENYNEIASRGITYVRQAES